jgi:hypothetical protein
MHNEEEVKQPDENENENENENNEIETPDENEVDVPDPNETVTGAHLPNSEGDLEPPDNQPGRPFTDTSVETDDVDDDSNTNEDDE